VNFFEINTALITPIYEQIKDGILHAVEKGQLKKGDRVPSINSLCRKFEISPGTVIKAYEDLSRAGTLSSVRGKGYFVANTARSGNLNIFMLFDRINAYKEILYDSFIRHIGPAASVQVFFHHYEVARFNALISENLGKFNYYVIMPHFNTDVSDILYKIPENKLLIIDKEVPKLKGKFASVCQHFEQDIYLSLNQNLKWFRNYRKINFIRSTSKFQFIPEGLIRGFLKFIRECGLEGEVISNIKTYSPQSGEVFIVFPESELIYLIRMAKANQWKLGKDIGIISYDDSPMKEILEGGITVLSTDFEAMGKTAAEMILSGKREKIYNPFSLIRRKSL
jgi:DNA-binding transcriptional regulator YhcF (GntR family)